MYLDQTQLNFQDVQKAVYFPEIVNLDPSRLSGSLQLKYNPLVKEGYKYGLVYEDKIRGYLEVQEDDLNKLFSKFINLVNEKSWSLLVQKASDFLFNGLISKNGIFITSDRFKYVQIKSLKELKTIYNVPIKEENINVKGIISSLSPYIESLFSNIKEYHID